AIEPGAIGADLALTLGQLHAAAERGHGPVGIRGIGGNPQRRIFRQQVGFRILPRRLDIGTTATRLHLLALFGGERFQRGPVQWASTGSRLPGRLRTLLAGLAPAHFRAPFGAVVGLAPWSRPRRACPAAIGSRGTTP